MLMANVLKKLIRESSLLARDFPSIKRQESAFVILNLFVLPVLLLIHTLFSSYFGAPPSPDSRLGNRLLRERCRADLVAKP